MVRKVSHVDHQERAAELYIGAVVSSTTDAEEIGRVVAVWPAIGMVDVQYPSGSLRIPVEELNLLDTKNHTIPPHTEDVPGGAGAVPVSGGPAVERLASRVAGEFLHRKAIYWVSEGRKYRVTREEKDEGKYYCPNCECSVLRPATHKKRAKLFGCPECMFLIEESDLEGCSPINPPAEPPAPTLPGSQAAVIRLLRGEE